MKASISLDTDNTPSENGIIKIWWWKDKVYNEQWESARPVWEFLNSYEVYILTSLQETVDVDSDVIFNNFILIP